MFLRTRLASRSRVSGTTLFASRARPVAGSIRRVTKDMAQVLRRQRGVRRWALPRRAPIIAISVRVSLCMNTGSGVAPRGSFASDAMRTICSWMPELQRGTTT